MSQVLDRPAPSRDRASASSATCRPRQLARPTFEVLAVLALFGLAIAVRLPYLWDIPRYTDELQEVLWSMEIARGERLPLTAVDSYYGPLWSYLLAALFKLLGPDPMLPRFTALLLGAAMVVLTYFFARDVAGRGVAAIAAGLLATSAGHVVINSHTARSNSITPLLTTGVLWLVFRAVEPRSAHGQRPEPDPRLLVPAGLLLGLALQTHLSVIALAPGLAAYALWRRPGLLATRWPWLAGLAVGLGYANMLAFNALSDFWSFRHASSLQAGYTDGRSTDLAYYLTNLGNLVQSLSRLLSGTIEAGNSPARFVYGLLALAGLVLLARGGGPLLALAALSIILILPYFNPRYGPILSGRYLIPLLPIGFVAIGVSIYTLASWIAGRRLVASRRAAWSLAVAAGAVLVLFPLYPLRLYYAEAVDEGRTNAPLHELAGVAVSARAADEVVLLDEGLAQEELGAGGNDLKAYRMLLATRGVPHVIAKVSAIDESTLNGRESALLIAEAKKRSLLPRSIRSQSLSREVESASRSEHGYVVYRLSVR